jgi:16S rRNA (guanine527-N7)-methyltransferase
VSDPTIPTFVRDDLAKLEIALDDSVLTRLARYLALLLEVNQQFNLTAIREPEAAWRRHIIDSLTVLPGMEHLTEGGTVIDVGSGGGLPGIPVAIARPDLSVTLLEATGKKAEFLRRCVAELPLPNARVISGRAEHVAHDNTYRQQFDVALSRAIGPMREMLEYTLPFVKLGGVLLAMKGPKAEQELADSADALDTLGGGELQVYEAYPEGFDQNTVIVSVAKERPTPKTFPRHPGIPRQTPL